jgi:predicted lipoprotein
MIKKLVLVGVMSMAGCAITPKPVAPAPAYSTMNSFKPDCLYGKGQINFLEQKLTEYQQYHETHPYTAADTQYYRQVKNALWALRSKCVVN